MYSLTKYLLFLQNFNRGNKNNLYGMAYVTNNIDRYYFFIFLNFQSICLTYILCLIELSNSNMSVYICIFQFICLTFLYCFNETDKFRYLIIHLQENTLCI